jgi:hypothetical protein
VRWLALGIGMVSLAICLLAPVGYFQGILAKSAMKTIFLLSSLTWFAAASYWSSRSER